MQAPTRTNKEVASKLSKDQEWGKDDRKRAASNKCDVEGLSNANALSTNLLSSVWTTDGLSKQCTMYDRPSSTPPTHLSASGFETAPSKLLLPRFLIRDRALDENNQVEEPRQSARSDLLASSTRNIQRSWSAPPVPDNVDVFFGRQEARLFQIGALDLIEGDTPPVDKMPDGGGPDWRVASSQRTKSSARNDQFDYGSMSPNSPVTSGSDSSHDTQHNALGSLCDAKVSTGWTIR
ncbi:hypothetical protein PINS_up008060 [Pythium insidiosum]|nr:hypothetical protein PINS_up008060 [Pythium insidiosum]